MKPLNAFFDKPRKCGFFKCQYLCKSWVDFWDHCDKVHTGYMQTRQVHPQVSLDNQTRLNQFFSAVG